MDKVFDKARIIDNINTIQNIKKTLRESNRPMTTGEGSFLLSLYQENTHLSQKLQKDYAILDEIMKYKKRQNYNG